VNDFGGAIETVGQKNMECGGKPSGTPLWMASRPESRRQREEKRRRASLAAALHSVLP